MSYESRPRVLGFSCQNFFWKQIIITYFSQYLFLFTCIGFLLICLSVHHIHTGCPQRPEEGTSAPRTGITDGFYRWGCKPDLLEEQQVLSTAGPSLQLRDFIAVAYLFYFF